MRKTNFGVDLYSGVAKTGKVMAYLSFIPIFIISLLLIIFGFNVRKQINLYTKQVLFNITSVTPINTGSSVINYTLTGTVVNCKNNIITINDYPNTVKIGQVITAYMRPGCIGSDAISSLPNNKMFGNVMIGFGIFLITISLLNIFLVKKYKGAAAAEGVGGIFSIFKKIFN